MAKTKDQKKEIISQYTDKLKAVKAVVILKNNKITANESVEIKKTLFGADSSFNVIKNTLFQIALKNAGLEVEEALAADAHSVVFIKEDIVESSKSLKKFVDSLKDTEGNGKLEYVSGYLDGAKLSKDQVMELAEMPDVRGSVALILGVLDQALSSVVNVLEDPVRSYTQIIDLAYKK